VSFERERKEFHSIMCFLFLLTYQIIFSSILFYFFRQPLIFLELRANEEERARKKFSLSKKKEIYLLCDVFSIRPEDYKAGFRDKKKQSSILRHRFRQFYHY